MTKHNGKKLESYLGFNFPWALAEELIKYELYDDGTASITYWAYWEDSRLGPEPTPEQIDPSLKPPEPTPPDPTPVEGDYGIYELSTWEIWLRAEHPDLVGSESAVMVPINETHGQLRRWPPEYKRPSSQELIDQSLENLDLLRIEKFKQARKIAAAVLLSSGMSYSDTRKAGSSLVNYHGAYLSAYFYGGAGTENNNFIENIKIDNVHPWLEIELDPKTFPVPAKMTLRELIVNTLK